MNWNDAAEDFLNLVIAQTPRPVRESTEAELRALAESMAEDESKNRVERAPICGIRVTRKTVREMLGAAPKQAVRSFVLPR